MTLYKLVTGLGVGREDLGVERDWPGPIPPGLLGPRRRQKKHAAVAGSPSPEHAPEPAVGRSGDDAFGLSRDCWSWLGLGHCHKYTYDAQHFRPEPEGDVAVVVAVKAS